MQQLTAKPINRHHLPASSFPIRPFPRHFDQDFADQDFGNRWANLADWS
jgi:hypothetical protein